MLGGLRDVFYLAAAASGLLCFGATPTMAVSFTASAVVHTAHGVFITS
jgi:hypothetical protein